MTRDEFFNCASALKKFYPKEQGFLPDKETIELWFAMLQDIEYRVLATAVNQWVSLNKWSPTIAELREMCRELATPAIPDWREAWSDVLSACSKYGRYNASEALASFSELTRKAVREAGGFDAICTMDMQYASRYQKMFEESYTAGAEKKKQEQKMAPAILKAAQRLQLEVSNE